MQNNEKIKAIVVTVSDTRHKDNDISGVSLVGLLIGMGAEVVDKIIISDDFEILRNVLYGLTERDDVNLIITTGGTGFADRAIIEREAPGLAEAMRFESLKKTPTAMLSRGVCGIRHNTLIINLPGSPKGAVECFEVVKPVLPHAINLLEGNTQH
jgi:molybdenum cofactor synthesis domain-containing protein